MDFSHWTYMDWIWLGSVLSTAVGFGIAFWFFGRPRSTPNEDKCRGAASAGAKRGGRG